MIQIEQNNLKRIADLHFEACKNYVLPRLEFYIELFNSLGHKINIKGVKSLSKRYELSDKSIIAIVSPYLRSKHGIKNKVNINQILSAINSSNNYIIKDANYPNKFKRLYDFFLLIKNNLEEIIKSNPVELDILIKSKKYISQNDINIRSGLEKIFSYEALIGNGFRLNDKSIWNNYSITYNLNLSVCPYCNRNWVNTVNDKQTGGKITSPQLDHFYSKSKYPLFRLSFYNLVPSCETCNSRLKKDIEFEFDENINPFVECYGDYAKFKIIPQSRDSLIGLSNEYTIELDTSLCPTSLKKKIEQNHEIFKLNEIYCEHGDIIAEIYRKKHVCSDRYLEILQKQFPELRKSKSELYRLAFGNYYDEKDFNKRPFSKLTKDLAQQLGLINFT